ncbi:hypothetical protein OCAE111667_09965 [Occultella aeris]|uniref:Uncharacterized protein n=1 Tax=Occultella aeris TaxID=2761496 RepID=A0A7M4DIG0_9MICO|nr:hypothetical protein HALOF300_01912 [Occultella aeris]
MLPLLEEPPEEESPEDDFFEELALEESPEDEPPDEEPLEDSDGLLFDDEPASLLPAPSEDVEAPRESVR